MKRLAWLGLAIAIGTWHCPAQETSSPSATAPALHTSIDLALAGYNAASSLPSDLHFPAASAESVVVAPPVAQRTFHPADTKFFMLNGLYLGMAVFDVEMTQRCIATRRCRELNPLMPSSNAGQLTINFALVAGVAGTSYWLRKHQSRLWWLPPATGAVVHSAGVATGFEHQ